MYVAVALPGAKARWHGEGDFVTLERVKIRGEESEGMICASNEIGLTSKNEGPRDILDLSSIKPKAGTPLSEILKRDDVIFEFDNKSLTHRPDLWGHYGIAREIAAIKGYKFKELKSLRPISPTVLKKIIEQFQIEMAYNSNAIEGNSLTLKETFWVIQEGLTIKEKIGINMLIPIPPRIPLKKPSAVKISTSNL